MNTSTRFYWTHHHDHKLMHSAFGLLAVIIASVCWLGTVGLWYTSQADTVESTVTSTITAQVGNINEGPSSGAGFQGPFEDKPEETKAKIQPQITAIGETTVIEKNSNNELVYVFTNQPLKFSGTTNIADAVILIKILNSTPIHSSTTSLLSGHWSWVNITSLPDGTYSAVFQAYSKSTPTIFAETRLIFKQQTVQPLKPLITPPTEIQITPSPSQNIVAPSKPSMLDLFLLVTIPPQTKKIQPGQPVSLHVDFLSSTSNQLITWPLTFTTRNEKMEIVSQNTDTISIPTGSGFDKLLYTAPNIPEGEYSIEVSTSLRDQLITSSDTFRIEGKKQVAFSAGYIDLNTIYISLFLLGLVFLILAYLEHRQFENVSRIIKQISEKDLREFNVHH